MYLLNKFLWGNCDIIIVKYKVKSKINCSMLGIFLDEILSNSNFKDVLIIVFVLSFFIYIFFW